MQRYITLVDIVDQRGAIMKTGTEISTRTHRPAYLAWLLSTGLTEDPDVVPPLRASGDATEDCAPSTARPRSRAKKATE